MHTYVLQGSAAEAARKAPLAGHRGRRARNPGNLRRVKAQLQQYSHTSQRDAA